MKKIISVLLIAVLMASVIVGCGSGSNEGVLRVGTNAEFPPFEYVGDDGQPDGFDIALIKAIGEISKTKLKEPLILFDEPETSLHPSFIDELTDCYSEVDPKTCLIISSHSARLVKNLITNSQHIKLYNIILHEKYSQISPMKQFTQYSPDSKYRVYDDHINAYFSKGILFVEGETELELFANPYLQILFRSL